MVMVDIGFTFHQFHRIIQIVMGWADWHWGHLFYVHEAPKGDKEHIAACYDGEYFQYGRAMTRIVEERYICPRKNNIPMLERIALTDEETEYRLEKDLCLEEVFGGVRAKDIMLRYVYDIGNTWEHHINFLGEVAPSQSMQFLGHKESPAFCFSATVREFFFSERVNNADFLSRDIPLLMQAIKKNGVELKDGLRSKTCSSILTNEIEII
jgi:hypothetical protein